jgi:hypothetical protein
LKFRLIVALVGIILLCVWIVSGVIFSKKIYSLYDIRLDGDIDVIGAIPLFEKKRKE